MARLRPQYVAYAVLVTCYCLLPFGYARVVRARIKPRLIRHEYAESVRTLPYHIPFREIGIPVGVSLVVPNDNILRDILQKRLHLFGSLHAIEIPASQEYIRIGETMPRSIKQHVCPISLGLAVFGAVGIDFSFGNADRMKQVRPAVFAHSGLGYLPV